jgi:hypothetical protein
VVTGASGWVVTRARPPVGIADFIVVDGRFVEIDVLAGPTRFCELDVGALDE